MKQTKCENEKKNLEIRNKYNNETKNVKNKFFLVTLGTTTFK